jgi:hypothetical protein
MSVWGSGNGALPFSLRLAGRGTTPSDTFHQRLKSGIRIRNDCSIRQGVP